MKKIALICTLLWHVALAQVAPIPGAKAWYPFDGNANDISGNHNNPIFNNATLTADRFGNPNSAYHFDGISSYMRIPNNPSLNFAHQITLSVWVRPMGFYYDICHASCMLSKGGGNYQSGNYALRFDDALYTDGKGCNGPLTDSLHQNFRGTGTVLKPYSPFVEKGKWYAVTYTNDGTTAKLYVDCKLVYSIDFPEIFTNNEDLYIGKSDDSIFPFWFNGDLDDVRIYDRALTANEITGLCDTPAATKKPVIPVTTPELPPVVIEKRANELTKQITVDHDSISVTLYDNGEIDGDSVTLIFNDKIITTHQRLTDQPLTYWIKIAPGNTRNELIMYAENLGTIPPNTALMVIYDGEKRYEVNVSSTETTNGVVSFRLRE